MGVSEPNTTVSGDFGGNNLPWIGPSRTAASFESPADQQFSALSFPQLCLSQRTAASKDGVIVIVFNFVNLYIWLICFYFALIMEVTVIRRVVLGIDHFRSSCSKILSF